MADDELDLVDELDIDDELDLDNELALEDELDLNDEDDAELDCDRDEEEEEEEEREDAEEEDEDDSDELDEVLGSDDGASVFSSVLVFSSEFCELFSLLGSPGYGGGLSGLSEEPPLGPPGQLGAPVVPPGRLGIGIFTPKPPPILIEPPGILQNKGPSKQCSHPPPPPPPPQALLPGRSITPPIPISQRPPWVVVWPLTTSTKLVEISNGWVAFS